MDFCQLYFFDSFFVIKNRTPY